MPEREECEFFELHKEQQRRRHTFFSYSFTTLEPGEKGLGHKSRFGVTTTLHAFASTDPVGAGIPDKELRFEPLSRKDPRKW